MLGDARKIVSRICICCNDPDNGDSLDKSEFIEIDFNNDDLLQCRLAGGEIVTKLRSDKAVQIGRIKVIPRTYKAWFGNWCWDSMTVPLEDAVKVFNYLARQKHWHCEESIEEIYEAFNTHRSITVDAVTKMVDSNA